MCVLFVRRVMKSVWVATLALFVSFERSEHQAPLGAPVAGAAIDVVGFLLFAAS